ncbi:MAG: NUDIX domain-containing protein [Armatimonadia bacterium]
MPRRLAVTLAEIPHFTMDGQRFRNSIKAVIIRDGSLLVTVNEDHLGEFLLLPGGGQHFGETMVETLQRECREELACKIVVHDLIGIREYIAAHHEFAELEPEVHQVEIMFRCDLAAGSEPRFGDTPDDTRDWVQTGTAWVPLTDLANHRIYPSVLREWLLTLPDPQRRYLGDVN